MRRALALIGALLLAGCGPKPVPASPAVWEVTAPDGGKAWLLGTVHSLDKPADWRSLPINAALEQADMILVELANPGDAAIGKTFADLAASPGHPLLTRRVDPQMREQLQALMAKHGMRDDQFAKVETWAVALTLAQAETAELNSKYGIDRAVIEAAAGKPIVELEGAARQLALFDRLPEAEQRDLLESVIRDAGALDGETPDLARAWREGDMKTIEAETQRGLLADPELREALFTGRNTLWAERITSELNKGKQPFVAVGAAHMAGPDGLPAMLEAHGFNVARIQ